MKSLKEILNESILDVDDNIDALSKSILNKKCKNFEAFVEMIAGYLGVETPKIIKKSEVKYIHRGLFARKTYTDVEIATIEFLRPGERLKESVNVSESPKRSEQLIPAPIPIATQTATMRASRIRDPAER